MTLEHPHTTEHSVGIVFVVGYPVVESSFDVTEDGDVVQNRDWDRPLRSPEIIVNPPNGKVQVVAVEAVNVRVQLACWGLVKEHMVRFNECLLWSLPLITCTTNPRWFVPSAPPITSDEAEASAELLARTTRTRAR